MPIWSSQQLASKVQSPQKLAGVFVLPRSLSSVLDIKYKYIFFFLFGCNYSVCLRKRKQEGEEKRGTCDLGVKEKQACVQSIK